MTFAKFDIEKFPDARLDEQVGDPRDTVANYGVYVHCEVGGFKASSHYARLKAGEDGSINIGMGERIFIGCRYNFPVDFYDNQQGSCKILLAGSPDEVGTRRTGLWIDKAHFPRLAYEDGSLYSPVWYGTQRLPVGNHTLFVEMVLSDYKGALTRLYVDGKVWGESKEKNVLVSTPYSRLIWGIGGASDQTTKRLGYDISECSYWRMD